MEQSVKIVHLAFILLMIIDLMLAMPAVQDAIVVKIIKLVLDVSTITI